jgi:hypothetical protein
MKASSLLVALVGLIGIIFSSGRRCRSLLRAGVGFLHSTLTKSAWLAGLCVLLASTGALAQTNPVPLINLPLVPTAIAPGGSTFPLTVNGTGFVSGSAVNWNGTALPTTFVNSSQLTATITASDIANPGTASITVTNPAPGGGTSLPAFFEITNPVASPTLVGFVQGTSFWFITSIVTGDFNGDGKLDLAVLGGISPSTLVCILLGNGDGSFQSPKCADALGNWGPKSLVAGDFNGDGKLDLAVANGNLNTISIFLGNGDGTLQCCSVTDFPAGPSPVVIATGDFNKDGKLDIAVINEPSPPGKVFSILLGNGDGTFQAAVAYTVAGTPTYLANVVIGDFNRDGNLDLVVSDYDGTPSDPTTFDYFVAGNGDGTFQPSVQAQTIYPYSFYSTVADLNGDGILDIVLTNNVSILGASVLLGNGDGTFKSGVDYSVGTPGFNVLCPIAVDDFNADGKLDLVYCEALNNNGTYYDSVEGFLLGNGDGTFQTATTLGVRASPPLPTQVVTGDFNGDGKVDMVVMQNYTDLGPAQAPLLIFLQGDFALANPSPYFIAFAGQGIGTTSPPQVITLTNTGNLTLKLSGLGIVGTDATDFAQTNTCGATLNAGASCPIKVTFTPTAQGSRNAAVAISDNGPGSPQMVALTGNSTPAPAATLLPLNIIFPSQYVGTAGLPQTVTLTNTGTAPLAISNVATNPADFGALNACGNSVAAGESCSIGVFFDPTTTGTRTGTLSVSDNAAGSPQTVSLSGTGQDYTMAASGSSTATVSPGQTASYTVAVAPVGGFAQAVSLTCSGAPTQSTCSVPSSVTLNGSTPTMVMVKVTTVGSSAALTQPGRFSPANSRLAMWLTLFGLTGLVTFGISGAGRQNRSRRVLYALAFVCLLFLGVTLPGCGGSGGGTGTPATYNLTVPGTFESGSTRLTHSTNLTLIMQ